jgi:diacylglycerol kinase family enzyme
MDAFVVSVAKIIGENASVHISRYPRDAISKVNKFLEAAEEQKETVRVYAVGGDGILFDCLNGMLKYRNHELTSVPYGNANDFLRAFNDKDVSAFRDIKNLAEAPTILTDVFNCGWTVCLTNAAMGLEGSSILETEKMAKKLSAIPFLRKLIPLLYIVGAVIVLLKKDLRSQYYNITIDGVDYSGEYIDVNIGNSHANGGKNTPNPYATPNDGWLDAVFIKNMSFLNCLRCVGPYTRGQYERYPNYFFHVRFKHFLATSDKPIRICADGETFYGSDLEVEVFHEGLKFAAPAGMTYHPVKEYVHDQK